MATTMSASPISRSNGSGLVNPPSIRTRPSMTHRLEENRQRHAGGDCGSQRPFREDPRLLIVEIRGDDLQRNARRSAKSFFTCFGRIEVEQTSMDPESRWRAPRTFMMPLERLPRGREQIAHQTEALRQNLPRVRAEFAAVKFRGVGGAKDRADGRAGDDLAALRRVRQRPRASRCARDRALRRRQARGRWSASGRGPCHCGSANALETWGRAVIGDAQMPSCRVRCEGTFG